MEPILSVEHLRRDYGGRGSVTHAVDDVSFSVERGSLWGSWVPREAERAPCSTASPQLIPPQQGIIRWRGRES